MAIPLGAENKRQVYLVIALFVVILAVGGYELFGPFGGSSTPVPPAPVPRPAAQSASSNGRPVAGARSATGSQNAQVTDAEKLDNEGLDPTVRFDMLAEGEDVEYAGTGRNIFSADSEPVNIPPPIAPPRPDVAHVVTCEDDRPIGFDERLVARIDLHARRGRMACLTRLPG